jgi:hypothetical protein
MTVVAMRVIVMLVVLMPVIVMLVVLDGRSLWHEKVPVVWPELMRVPARAVTMGGGGHADKNTNGHAPLPTLDHCGCACSRSHALSS